MLEQKSIVWFWDSDPNKDEKEKCRYYYGFLSLKSMGVYFSLFFLLIEDLGVILSKFFPRKRKAHLCICRRKNPSQENKREDTTPVIIIKTKLK